MTIYNTIQNKSGFCTLNFNIDEKNTIKNFVTKKFESNLKKYKLPKIKIENYHKLKISDILHKKIFTRENRTVSKHFINFIKKTSVFNKISKEFNFIKFSKKVIYNKFDVFWRIVRPLKNDVGDIHADEWFWSVNNWKVPKGYECLKFWIMLSDNLNYGLSIIPRSHKINFPYKKIFKYIEKENSIWERKPMEKLAKDNQLNAFKYDGFWYAMDTIRDKNYLEGLWNSKKAPWKSWDGK